MMRVLNAVRYSYPNSRIRAMKSSLLKESDFEHISECRNLKEFMVFLENSAYREDIYHINKPSLVDMESMLWKNLLNTLLKIYSFAPGATQKFLYERIGFYDISALKTLINLKGGEGIIPVYEPLPITPRMNEKFPRLLEAKSVDELILNLEGTPYGDVLRESLEEHKRSKLTLPLNLALDQYHLTRLWNLMKKLPSEDRIIARNLLGAEIDCTNIMTLLRITSNGNNPDKFIIKHYYHLRPKTIEECMKCNNITEVLAKLSETEYGAILNAGIHSYNESKSLLSFELGFEKFILNRNRAVLSGDPFQIGTLLGFMKLKETEIRNLQRIIVGISNGLPSGEIKDMIIS